VWFRTQEVGDNVILNLLADMNLERSEIHRVGESLIRSPTVRRIVVNLHHVEFLSSTFLNRLILLRKSVLAAEGKLILCGLNPVIQEIFETSKLDSLFDLSGNTEEAMGSP